MMLNRNMPLLPLDRRVWSVPVVQKKHKESIVQAPLRSILSCRLCEGFSVKSIGLVTGSKGCKFHTSLHSPRSVSVVVELLQKWWDWSWKTVMRLPRTKVCRVEFSNPEGLRRIFTASMWQDWVLSLTSHNCTMCDCNAVRPAATHRGSALASLGGQRLCSLSYTLHAAPVLTNRLSDY